jgi:hypothetical protein
MLMFHLAKEARDTRPSAVSWNLVMFQMQARAR